MKHIKLFKTDGEYLVFAESDKYVEPHVSLAEDDDIIHYNKVPEPPKVLRHMTHVITQKMIDESYEGQYGISLSPYTTLVVNGEEQIKGDTPAKSFSYPAGPIDGMLNMDSHMVLFNSFDENKLFTPEDGTNLSISGDFEVTENTFVVAVLYLDEEAAAAMGLPAGFIGLAGPYDQFSVLQQQFPQLIAMFSCSAYTVIAMDVDMEDYSMTMLPCTATCDNSASEYVFPMDEPRTYEIDFDFKEGVTIVSRGIFGNESLTYLSDNALKGVTSIGENVFAGYSNLTSITIPDSVTNIDFGAFQGCTSLTSVTIGSGVTSIGNYAFNGCISLTSVTYTSTIAQWNTIAKGNNWHYYVPATTVHCTDGDVWLVNYISTYNDGTTRAEDSISNKANLINVVITPKVTSISEKTFSGCTNLTSVTIGKSVTNIDYAAFSGCSNLISVTIPDSVTSIAGYAFAYCRSLKEITCNAVVAPSIYTNTFTSVATDGALYTPEGSDYSSWMDTSSYYLGYYNWLNNPEEIEITYTSTNGSVVTPHSSVIVVSNEYVDGVGKLKISISNGNLPNNIFSGKTTLESVSIPNSITGIGSKAFQSCTSLTSITIPDSVTNIGEHAFHGCYGLESVIIPDSITSIGWGAFSGCTSLASIEIPDSVTSIGSHVFYGCTSLTSIEIPDSVTSIGYNAFNYCKSLTSVTIPDSVTSIGDSAFVDCSSLISIIVDENNPVYDSRNNCNAIIETATNTLIAGCQTTIIPDSITSIGYNAFYGCSSLTSITIPDSVTSIGYQAFSGCTSLTSVTIPDSVTIIGERVFQSCIGLTSVTYNGTIEQWSTITKGDYWKMNVPSSCMVHCTDGDIAI